MNRLTASLSPCVWLVMCGGTLSLVAAPPEEGLSRLRVSKDKISFDPKTVEVGDYSSFEGNWEVHAKILNREGDKCVIEHITVAPRLVSESLHRIEVPVDAGPLTFGLDSDDGRLTSLPKGARMTYTRRYAYKDGRKQFGDARALVPGTDEWVEFSGGEPQNKKVKPRKGDTVQFSYSIFNSDKFDNPLESAHSGTQEFEVGSDKMWPWLVLAMEDMTLGDSRRVQVPVKVAEGATKWLLKPEQSKTIYAEIRLMFVERAKR